MGQSFVHLHVHSEYSILQSSARIAPLISRAKEFDMPGFAITDLGNMYCALDFYGSANKAGLKPVIGFEAFVAEESRFEKKLHLAHRNYSLLLYAKNLQGYHNLLKLCSLGWVEGYFQGTPRIDEELLANYCSDIVVVMAQKKGRVNALLQEHGKKEALDYIFRLRELVGADNFYLEIVNHGLDEDRELNEIFREFSNEAKIPLVATNDTYYTDKDDSEAHEVLMAIGAKRTMADPARPVFVNREFYFKPAEEMYRLFAGYEDACENTMKIFADCNLQMAKGGFHLPEFPCPEGITVDDHLRDICVAGLSSRYGSDVAEPVFERLNYELGVISRMGYSAYFLIVADFISAARKNGIPVGPGRGSAAGSLVAYLTGITNLCPLRYGLYFERFLNPERVSMPDIDIDFCYRGRSDVIQYVRDFYGSEKVAQIITYGTMKTKAVLKDVARVFEVHFQEANDISKCVPDEAKNLRQALELSAELRRWQEQYEKLFDVALRLEGLIRQTGIHAAGVIIAPADVSNFVPLARTEDGSISTQFEGTTLESQGLLKMDFLGLSTLTVIQDCLNHVKANRGIEVDIDTIPLDDPGVFKMLSEARTAGLFQVDSPLFQGILRQMQPQRFEDIVALVALGRPGPLGMKMDVVFCDCRHDPSKITYPHPLLQDLLSETYGVLLYQEQVMNAAVVMAGYTMAEADDLRKAMGKKLADKMAAHRDKFVEGALKNHQIPSEKSNAVFDLMATFAEYGFNKSHSAAYALICYQTAWLKVHYPQEFMAAAMTDKIEDQEQIHYLCEDCLQMGIKIMPPDVNSSYFAFSVNADAIIFGLGAIKGIGSKAVECMVNARQSKAFHGLRDFCHRADLSAINKKVVEQLVRVGAFDNFGIPRQALLPLMMPYYREGQEYQKSKRTGQKSLFELKGGSRVFDDEPDLELHDSQVEKLAWEKELAGVYFSGHPMEPYREYVRLVSSHEVNQLCGTDAEGRSLVDDNTRVLVAGMVCGFRRRVSKSSGEDWASFRLVDFTGGIDCVVFARQFKNVTFKLLDDQIVVVSGVKRRQSYSNEPQIIADSVEQLDFLHESGKWKSDIGVVLDVRGITDDTIQVFRELSSCFPGQKRPLVYCDVNGYKVNLEMPSRLGVSGNPDCVRAFYQAFGREALRLHVAPPPVQGNRN